GRKALTVTLDIDNLAPRVTLRASQHGETPGSFGRSAGEVRIVADIRDPNASDAHVVQWTAPPGASFTTDDALLILQPQSLPVGVHRFEAVVTDNGMPSMSSRATLDIVIADHASALPAGASGWLDNGLPDHPGYSLPMPNVLPERVGE